jgi:hypothetical protein
VWLREEARGKDEDMISFLHQHQTFSMVYFIHILITLSNDFCLKLLLPYSYDLCKGYFVFQKIVAGSKKVSQLFIQVLTVEINFECKNAPTGKFSTRAVKGAANWLFRDSL